ncbi:hypothetical protein MIB92_16275 [Aestuariirhabdus sp. Z084]|uniref:hypothetical protein n=1 Tax=Aestuariirhabdus haliotis TaxID=2918751 RepID=UPI00201B3ADF|nr:hypothetical protein [Aestuariirhabdus haliotis]MCL6417218.1 hypothetical protein [Aestuariirhabdus haliotis]MCL6421190.1 hypothetical protein [Aestuariirhabdus haliotis]
MDSEQATDSVFKRLLNRASNNRLLVIVLLVLGYVYPLGCYLMWRGKHFNRNIRWAVTALMIVRFVVVLLLTSQSGNIQSEDGYYESSGCSEVLVEGNCTYYRDSNCAVIARHCE